MKAQTNTSQTAPAPIRDRSREILYTGPRSGWRWSVEVDLNERYERVGAGNGMGEDRESRGRERRSQIPYR
jgi:hypothetical protein